MYASYPDFEIDIEKEQALLIAHDRIIFQFPLYWYATPPLLKKWLDDVLTYGFAYGSTGDQLKGKDMQLLVSVGGQQRFYNGFDIYTSLPDLLRPFQMTANLTQMNYLPPDWMHNADQASQETILNHGKRIISYINDPNRSNARRYIASGMVSDIESTMDTNPKLQTV